MTIFQSVTADLAPEIAIYTNPELLDSLAEQTGANYKYALNDVILVGTWESINDAYVLLTDLKNEMQENLPKQQDAIESFDQVEIPSEATVDGEIIPKQELTSEIEAQSALFDCANCGESFQESIELDEHTLVCHASKNSCLCPICSTTFSCKNSLHLHLKTFHSLSDQHINALNCTNETEVDQSDQELELPHPENVQSESLVEESEDDTQFDDPEFDPETESTLKDSSKKRGRKRKNTQDKSQPALVGSVRKRGRPRKNACEDSENSFPCEHCSKLFRDERKVSDHMKKDHPEKCLSCNGCEKLFINASLLDAHSKKCSNFLVVCTECNEEFTDRKLFKEHLRTVHDRKRFECEGCSQKFLTPHTLLLHIKNCSEDFHIQLPEDWGKSDPQNQSVPCPHCQSSIDKNDLANHLRSTHVDKCKPCMKCDFLCLNSHDLTRHLLNLHDDDYTNCTICSVQFQNTAAWTEHHLSVHQNSNLFRCPYCDQYFSRFTMRANHMYDEHEIGVAGSTRHRAGKTGSRDTVRFDCLSCGQEFKDKTLLSQHVKSEHDGKRFTCIECFKDFKSAQTLKDHMNAKHCEASKRTIYKCQVCGKRFSRSASLYNHKRLHTASFRPKERATCPTCGKSYSNIYQMQEHVKIAHEGKRFSCTICPRQFKGPRGLKDHMFTRHGSSLNKKYDCSMCDESFISYSSFYKHKRTHSLPPGQELIRKDMARVKCQTCLRDYANVFILKEHIQVEHEGKRYRCDICDLSYKMPKSLKDHNDMVHSSNPVQKMFQCKYCSKVYTNRVSWYQHEKHHIDPTRRAFYLRNDRENKARPRHCPVCGILFENHSKMYTHRNIVHRGKRRQCPRCGKLFNANGHVRRHMLSVHKEDMPPGFRAKMVIVDTSQQENINMDKYGENMMDNETTIVVGPDVELAEMVTVEIDGTEGELTYVAAEEIHEYQGSEELVIKFDQEEKINRYESEEVIIKIEENQ